MKGDIMKALKNRTPFIIVTAFMLLTISAFGISKSVISSNDIAEINKSDIVLHMRLLKK